MGGTAHCGKAYDGNWLGRTLYEGWDAYHTVLDLQEQDHWPGPEGAMINGGHLVDRYYAEDRVLDVLTRHIFEDSPTPMLFLYAIGGPLVDRVGSGETAYGGRDAKWVVHYKHVFNENDHNRQVSHHRELSRALDRVLPCRGFYNYADKDFTCARSNEEWLQAHFLGNLPRMRYIKRREDPNLIFRSRLS